MLGIGRLFGESPIHREMRSHSPSAINSGGGTDWPSDGQGGRRATNVICNFLMILEEIRDVDPFRTSNL